MLGSRVIGIAMQAVYFVLVARTLGTNQFGMFMGVSAFAVVLNPFSTVGSADLLVRDVSRDRSLFREGWANALLTTAASGSCLIALAFLIALQIFPDSIPPLTILLILISDTLGLAIWGLSSSALVGFGLLKKVSQLQIFMNFSKLIAAIVLFIGFKSPSIIVWSILYFLANVSIALTSVMLVHKMIGFPGKPNLSKIKSNFNQGIYFSIGASADVVNSSIDKTMLTSLSTANATGLYSAAYRFIEVAYLPLLSIFSSTYAKFFEQGKSGITGSFSFAKKLIPLTIIYGFVAFIGYWIFHPLIPYILGEEYKASMPVVLWLSPMPFLIGMQWIAADTLTGSGYQKIRGFIILGTALLNVGINRLLIPIYSWRGATWATLTSDIFKVLLLWAAVAFLYRRQMRHDETSNPN